MAAAEARAAWQRAANRCFVQEDAKRAPKLPPPPPSPPPPCSSSSSSSAPAPDTNNMHSHGHHHQHNNNKDEDDDNCYEHHQPQQLILNLTPLNRNPYPISTNFANLPADTRWWLQLHPNFAYQREFQFLLYDDTKHHVHVHPPHPPISPSPDFDIDFYHSDSPKTSLSMSNSNTIGKNGEDTRRLRYDVKSYEDPLMLKKREPWWRVSDGEELASVVAQKATQHIENCDLPRPIQTNSCSDLYPDPTVEVGMPALGNGNGNADYDNDDNLPSRKVFGSLQSAHAQRPFCWDDKLQLGMECSARYRLERQQQRNETEEGKGSREELLEALCHSQTRARQAEMAAKKAHSEKEDIMKLLFRQASHLFACKQWLKMLQLENLCLQLRIRDHHYFPFNSNSKLPSQPPPPPPPSPHKGKNSICRYVMLVAVGWGLAGAGLLLGWTLGWLLPML